MRRAWLLALAWGIFTIFLASMPALFEGGGRQAIEQAFAAWLAAIIVIVIALFLRRGSRIAAWALIAYTILDIGVRVVSGPKWLLPPIVVLAFAWPAAMHLQKDGHVASRGETWIKSETLLRIVYGLAFIQGALTLLFVVWSLTFSQVLVREVAGQSVTARNVLDVAILLGLGFGVFKRLVWAGYALFLYQLLNIYLAIQREDPLALGGALAIALVYGLGAGLLHRKAGRMGWTGRAAVGVALLLVAIRVGFLAMHAPSAYDLAFSELNNRMLATPELRELAGQRGPEAVARGREMALNGARRLPDAQLVERARLLATILDLVDEHSCAEQFRGGRGSVDQALRRADIVTLRGWTDIVFAEFLAESRQDPPIIPNPTDDAVSTAMQEVVQSLPPAESERYVAIANQDVQAATDADACWMFRRTARAIPALSPSAQATIARLIVAR